VNNVICSIHYMFNITVSEFVVSHRRPCWSAIL